MDTQPLSIREALDQIERGRMCIVFPASGPAPMDLQRQLSLTARRCVVTDAGILPASTLAQPAALYSEWIEQFALQLGCAPDSEDGGSRRQPVVEFERFLRFRVCPDDAPPLVWLLDRIDVLFDHPSGSRLSEVFGLWRSWILRRRWDARSWCSRLTLVLCSDRFHRWAGLDDA